MKKIGATYQKGLPGYYEGLDKDAKAAQDLYNEARVGGTSQAKLNEIKIIQTVFASHEKCGLKSSDSECLKHCIDLLLQTKWCEGHIDTAE